MSVQPIVVPHLAWMLRITRALQLDLKSNAGCAASGAGQSAAHAGKGSSCNACTMSKY